MATIFNHNKQAQTQLELHNVLLAIDDWATRHKFRYENSIETIKEQLIKDFNDPDIHLKFVNINESKNEKGGSIVIELINTRYNLFKDLSGLKFWHVLIPITNGFNTAENEVILNNACPRTKNQSLEEYQKIRN